MGKQMNKKWARPKLTILTRGDRQEGVLVVCKTWDGADYGSPYAIVSGCVSVYYLNTHPLPPPGPNCMIRRCDNADRS